MEEPINRSSNKERRKKQILVTSSGGGGGGGGGIGGALLLGGAFAAAAAAAFLINSVNKGNKKKPIFPTLKKEFLPQNCESNKEEKEERNEGLLSLLQNPSPSADSYLCVAKNRIGSTKIDDSMAIETPISEEKLKSSVTCRDDKIVFDNLKAECFDNNVILDRAPIIDFEGLSSPDMEMCVLNQENINKEDCVEDSLFVEAIAMTGEKVELSEIANMVNMIHEEEEEDDEEEQEEEESDEDDEDIENDDESIEEEEEVEDSEGTGGSSRESNAEAIWPVELIEEEQILELKNQQNDGIFLEKIFKTETVEEEDWDEENMEMEILMNEEKNETGFMMMGHDQNAPLIIISKSKFRLLSTLTVGLLLLMILYHLLLVQT